MSKLMKNSMFIAAILYIIMGLGLIVFRHSALNVICYISGIAGIIYGAIRILMYFSAVNKGSTSASMTVGGVLLILGLVLVIHAQYIVSILAVIIGIAIAADSIVKIQSAVTLKAQHSNKWKSLLIGALIMLAISLVLLFNPLNGSTFIAIVMGIALIADAVFNLICIWTVSKTKNTDFTA